MKEINQLISELENNVGKLLGQLDQTKKELGFLKEESIRLKLENEKLKKQLSDNEVLSSVRNIAEGVGDRIDSESARKKLNELIREIDKCILLLED